MSILQVNSRPVIAFDVTNRKHREYYAGFLLKRSWGDCPVCFCLEQGYGDVSSMIENKLTAYYLERELKKRIPTKAESWSV